MKRFLLALATFLTLTAVPVMATTSAVNVFPECNGQAANTDVCKSVKSTPSKGNPVVQGIKVAITILSAVIGVASVIIIIVSALQIVLANGDSQVVAKARSSIIYALVGLAIAALAVTIVNFALNNVG